MVRHTAHLIEYVKFSLKVPFELRKEVSAFEQLQRKGEVSFGRLLGSLELEVFRSEGK